jgi:hypothetical protein
MRLLLYILLGAITIVSILGLLGIVPLSKEVVFVVFIGFVVAIALALYDPTPVRI